MADDSITERQGREIISALDKIVSELQSLNRNVDRIQSDVSDMQLKVKWIEKKVSMMD